MREKKYHIYLYPAVIATNGTSQGDTTINNAYIENVKFDYRPGDAPQATAQVEDSSSDRYEVAYECWEEMENGNPVAFWYSDEGKYACLLWQFPYTTFVPIGSRNKQAFSSTMTL